MFGRIVGVAATCALSASALILPPGIAPASTSEAPDLSVSIVDPKSQSIIIPCSACAFPTKQENAEDLDSDDALFWIQGGANSVQLDFTVSEDGQNLLLDGAPIHPPQYLPQQRPRKDIHVKQVPSYVVQTDIISGKDRSTDLEVTAYGLVELEKEALSPNGDMLVPIRLKIMGLENEFMILDEVEIKLLQTGTGELLIMQVTNFSGPEEIMKDTFSIPPPPPGMDGEEVPPPLPGMDDVDFPPPPFHGHPYGPPHNFNQKECSMLPAPLCKLRNMLESKIDAAMRPPHGFRKSGGCPGRKGRPNSLPTHTKPHLQRPGEEDRPKHHHGRPHHMRPHAPHHSHHHRGQFWRHHFLHAFAKGMVAVLIPVMAGITVGMTVSLLGLVVGRLIGFLWIKFVRGGRRGYASVVLEEAVVEEDEDKAMLAEMEAPPVYEDAPAYEEAGKDEK